jgi:hypothetical protein
MKHTLMTMALLAAFGSAHAADFSCPAGTLNCSNQSMGDTQTDANNNQSHATQIGNSTASNQSGNSMHNGSNDLQQSGNSNSVQSGNHTNANGGAGGNATGNLSNNDNRSSVGNTSSNSGGNTMSNGSNSGGNILGNSGGNSSNSNMGNSKIGDVGNGNGNGNGSNNTTTANGGAGGAGGAGGQGGNATGGQGGKGGSAAQGQGQGQGQSSNNQNNVQGSKSANANKNSATTGNNKNANSTSNDGSGNSNTRVDASDRSSTKYESKTIFIPPIIPPTPASHLAVGNIVKETTACGPLVKVVESKVEGTFHGLFFDSKVDQGKHQEMTEWRDEQGNIIDYREVPLPDGSGYRLFGHQVTQYTAIVGVSGARNIALGGGGSEGNWGQGGMGTSSANQRLVTTLQVRGCEIGTWKHQQVQPYEIFMTKRIRN